jgi:hypothetical protein
MRNGYKIFFGKPEGKRQLERYGHRWEDNVRIELREIEWQVLDWIHLAQDRDSWGGLMNTVMKFQVPQKAVNFLTI